MSTFGIGIPYPVFTLKYTVSFNKGTLFHKTPNVSSGMLVEQTHEQNNNMYGEGTTRCNGYYRKSLHIHTVDGRMT